ncbi:hypothetical protein HYV21_02035 [Candidatus Microgenomates bacterium]|nr:hypothetical protein [Candidatus Microgenomates bacterium]
MPSASEVSIGRRTEITFAGRTFDKGELFSPTPESIAQQLAFPADYSQARLRLKFFTDAYQFRDFYGEGRLNPIQIGEALVEQIDAYYDPEEENTLEITAALIARYPDFLATHGLAGDEAKYAMLLTATQIEIDRTRRLVRETGGDQYYRTNLRAFQEIKKGLRTMSRKLQPTLTTT